jgi:hypothetical protein
MGEPWRSGPYPCPTVADPTGPSRSGILIIDSRIMIAVPEPPETDHDRPKQVLTRHGVLDLGQ